MRLPADRQRSRGLQTTLIPVGGGAIVEMKVQVPPHPTLSPLRGRGFVFPLPAPLWGEGGVRILSLL